VFGNYLIGLREGLEASLVVCILVAYLVKTDNRSKLPPVWAGVGIAAGVSLAFGAGLQFGTQELTFTAQEAIGGSLSIAAVGLVTWMVFWMRRTARHLKAELEGKLEAALAMGSGALVATAFLAVGREGIETSLFVWRSVDAADDGVRPLIGALLGIVTAIAMGWLFYRGALRINLARFFTWTGGVLIVVAAGVLAYGVHDLQEARFLGGLENKAFDVSSAVPADSWYAILLKGTVNFQPDPTVVQACVWVLYVIPVLYLFLRGSKAPSPSARGQRQDGGEQPQGSEVAGQREEFEGSGSGSGSGPSARSEESARSGGGGSAASGSRTTAR
jgi:high-affinity iron transporter